MHKPQIIFNARNCKHQKLEINKHLILIWLLAQTTRFQDYSWINYNRTSNANLKSSSNARNYRHQKLEISKHFDIDWIIMSTNYKISRVFRDQLQQKLQILTRFIHWYNRNMLRKTPVNSVKKSDAPSTTLQLLLGYYICVASKFDNSCLQNNRTQHSN